MNTPLALEDLLAEFNNEKMAWVIRDSKSGLYLVVPDDRFPGRKPIRFFLSEANAMQFASAVLEASTSAGDWDLKAEQVKLIPSLHSIASSSRKDYADSFVVHGPNEVFHFMMDRLLI